MNISDAMYAASRAVQFEFARQKFNASAGPGIWGTLIPPIDTRAIARAVIEAMHAPTAAMAEAGAAHVSAVCTTLQSIDEAKAVYRAMLDAALAPPAENPPPSAN